MEEKIAEKRIRVLEPELEEEELKEIVDKKKTDIFRSRLRKPKPEDVHVDSLELTYEPYLVLNGKFDCDYYRKGSHTLDVDNQVKEVVIGKYKFPTKENRLWAKHKRKVEIELEEHVVIKNHAVIALDSHGDEVEFPYEITTETVAADPAKILDDNKQNVRKLEIKFDEAVARLRSKLVNLKESPIRVVSQIFSVDDAKEVYVPVYEARCLGPDSKVALLRIDAVTKKVR
ncbi:MAG: hypothetical protein ACE5KA_07660 [Nitrososphaerales archaeon]